ncbi:MULTISPECIES: GNAT family N-acetyltransferase [unclassified Paenibacillus]|uniref:GNAT family N-acetyltransferase n=1 Tax=unclassified Paenibacillus TaxID=185978 RepID=UPI000CFCCC13|nr:MULTISPECIES: GNAT family protein [unclassified Paenibacillus]PRA05736.1 N-acetyltransferase [Paenibacillus sp. MYb63]PRA49914.1 N-acetyltransferase [Paenibacillus sp. MYb67]QZN75681.1 GNAT family N-acetyltransferase [Paenibacillus sp. DR312]
MSEQFRFDLFPLIQTKRFILRSAEAGDSHDLLALYSDEAVVQYMPFTPFESVEDAQGEMNWYTKIFKEHTGLRWMIEDRETRKVIGTCGFLNYEDVHHRAEIGYDLRSSFWGRGVMTEVACAVLHFGFTSMQLNKIEAKVEPENEASIRLLHKLGFQQEGVLRQHEFEKGRYIDLAVFSKLRSEI